MRAVVAAATVLLASACVQVGESTVGSPRATSAGPIDVQVENCIDRTETPGRDLGAEATQAFREKLHATKEFKVAANARHRLTCEVSIFVEGSAVKRWIMPGWGATVGQVSAMLTDTRTGEVLVIARGNATVSSGGLYTVGAEGYIVPTAVDSVVAQLREWALGGAAAADSGRPDKKGAK